MINLLTEKEAAEKYCPFNIDDKCITKQCMAWIELYQRVEREDHSNATATMQDLAMKRNKMYRREGPRGCMCTLILDEQGYCARCIDKSLIPCKNI
jgi:hypothetical protein